MSGLHIDGNWDIIADQLRMRWGSLTPEDLTFNQGEEEALIMRLSEKTGEDKEVIIQAIKKALRSGDMC